MTTHLGALPTSDGPAPGDPDLRERVLACAPDLRRRAMALTGSAQDASDLVQDTLERGLTRLGQFQRDTSLLCWALAILRNRFLDQCRARAASRRATERAANELEHTVPHPAEALAEAPVWTQISAAQFRAAVDELDPVQREVFRLRVVELLSYEQIGERLGIPSATVGSRLSRVRSRLREALLAATVENGDG